MMPPLLKKISNNLLTKKGLKHLHVRFSQFITRHWLPIGFVLLSVNLIWNSSVYNRPERVDQQHISTQINSAIFGFEKLVAAWFASPDKETFENELWKNLSSNGFTAKQAEEGIELYLFRKDSLLFWNTNNTISSKEILEHFSLKDKLDTMGNAIVYTHCRAIGQFKAILCISIKHHYPYENQFLKNSFNVYLFNTQNIEITKKTKNTLTIKGSNGQELFYIRPLLNKKTPLWSDILGWLGVMIVILGFLKNMEKVCTSHKVFLNIGVALTVVVLMRLATFWLGFPTPSGILFESVLDSKKIFVSSLGNVLMDSLVILMVVGFLFKMRHKLKICISRLTSRQRHLVQGVYVSLYVFATVITHYVLTSLIFESSIELGLYKILNINALTFVCYLIAMLVTGVRIILLYLGFEIFKSSTHNRLLIAINVVLLAVVLPFNSEFHHTGFLLVLSQVVITVLLLFNKDKQSHRIYLITLAIMAFYLSSMIFYASRKAQSENQQLLMTYLAKSRNMKTENILKRYFYNLDFGQDVDDIRQGVSTKLTDLLPRYKITLTVDSSYYGVHTGRNQDSIRQIKHEIDQVGHRIGTHNTPIYTLQDNSGMENYVIKNQSSPLYILVTEDRKLQNFVFRSLTLQDENSDLLYKDYSYARYFKSYLVESKGSYRYDLYVSNKSTGGKANFFKKTVNDYTHLIFDSVLGNSLVVSAPDMTLYNVVSLFIYIFVLLLIGVFLVLIISGYPYPFSVHWNSISFKVRTITVVVITLSTIGTIWFVMTHYTNSELEKNRNKMVQYVEIIQSSYTNRNLSEIVSLKVARQWSMLTREILGVDMVIYDREGTLLTLSDPSILKDKIIGDKMSPAPYYLLKNRISKLFIEETSIGNLDFISIYVPILHVGSNQIMGFIVVPFLKDNMQADQGAYSLIINILNAFSFVVFLAILFSFFLYQEISRPLSYLSQSIGNIHLKKKVDFSSRFQKDEIGTLVTQYNNMIDELEENYKQLSQREREAAWKQIAQQVAHEIKNPLTPMKLKIQMIQRLKDSGNQRWLTEIDSTFEMLLQQIDLLAAIASEFSAIGKIDTKTPQRVNLNAMLVKLREFYTHSSMARVVYDNFTGSEPVVLIDYDSVWRAFVNICTNAVYAIGSQADGEVRIGLTVTAGTAVISISDNGVGMSQEDIKKVFQYSFTTKKSGSGLGLVITRQIIENYGGSVSFQSQLDVGTTFYVSFPVV